MWLVLTVCRLLLCGFALSSSAHRTAPAHFSVMSASTDAMSAQLAALPPHLKLMIMNKIAQTTTAATTAAAVSTANSGSSADATAVAVSASPDADGDAAIDPAIPPPFALPAAFDFDRVAADLRLLSAPMVRALATQGFIIVDSFAADDCEITRGMDDGDAIAAAVPALSTSVPAVPRSELQRALEEARGLHRAQRLTHAGMKAAAAASSTGIAAAAPSAAAAAPAPSSAQWKSAALRGDQHLWLHADDAAERDRLPALHGVVSRMDALRLEINRVLRDEAADAAAAGSSVASTPAAAASVAVSASASASATAAASFPALSSSGTGWRQSLRLQVQLACFDGNGARYVKSAATAIIAAAPFLLAGALPHFGRYSSLTGGCDPFLFCFLSFCRHRDSIPGQAPFRRLTCILYISEWSGPEQGGCLRLYTKPLVAAADATASAGAAHVALPYFDARRPDRPATPPADSIFPNTAATAAAASASAHPDTSAVTPTAAASPSSVWPSFVDVAPLAHRLVLFSSAELLHEVLPSFDLERFAITMWME